MRAPAATPGLRAEQFGREQQRSFKVVPLRHPARWLSALIVLALLAFFGLALANAQISWATVGKYFASSPILIGFAHTILISVLAMLLGLLLGLIFAVMRLSVNPVTSGVAWLYVWLFRGTPIFLQLLLWFNLALIFPHLHIPGIVDARTVQVITPFVAALLGLGINEGAYVTEIIRGGILSVDEGQRDAAAVIGLSPFQTLRLIILPQAMRVVIPPLGNEAIGMLKFSSLASVISYSELLNKAQSIYYVNGQVMELLIVASIWYIIATSVLSTGQYFVERRFGRSQRGRPQGDD